VDYPNIYLVLDNCFAIKRWVEPGDWIPLCKQIGFDYIQASFDNEIDMLYSPSWYQDKWFKEVRENEEKHDARVVTFYTGYQTYRTAGLGHPDKDMAERLMNDWVFSAIDRLGQRGNGFGFSFHAIVNHILQDPGQYREMTDRVYRLLGKIGGRAHEKGGIPVCVEAMYAPHQPPWTIKGTRDFLRECMAQGCNTIYTTVDVGHMIGQSHFLRPSTEVIRESLRQAESGQSRPGLWLGADSALALWREYAAKGSTDFGAAERISEEMDRYPYLFADGPEDSDPYAWLEELGCYSPIMHLQQTNGITASHASFTQEANAKGIITPEKVLQAIAKSYQKPVDPAMPPRAKDIYLAFELFFSNSEHPHAIIEKLEESLAFWRTLVPRDGMPLADLVDMGR